MNNINVGIPRALFFYEEGYFFEEFFKLLGFNVIVSNETNKEIYTLGEANSNDEMCTSLKIFIGHVMSLKDKCDYILNFNMDNEGLKNQGCTNYIATNEIIKNILDKKTINIDINHMMYKTLYKQCLKLTNKFNISSDLVKKSYMYAKVKNAKRRKEIVIENTNKLYLIDKKKVLIAGHSYNIHDKYITEEIINFFKNRNIEIIYSDYFDYEKTKEKSKDITTNLYWKNNKQYIGAISLAEDYVDYIVTISTFPCSNDLLVNNFIRNKIKKPILNLLLDDINSLTGIITRLESFIDINEN